MPKPNECGPLKAKPPEKKYSPRILNQSLLWLLNVNDRKNKPWENNSTDDNEPASKKQKK